MKKYAAFIIKGKPTVYELKAEKVTPLQDPSVKWLPEGEYKVNVLAPISLYEKDVKGKDVPVVFYSHALFDTEAAAVAWHKQSLESTMKERAERHGEEFSKEALKAKIAEITVTKL